MTLGEMGSVGELGGQAVMGPSEAWGADIAGSAIQLYSR